MPRLSTTDGTPRSHRVVDSPVGPLTLVASGVTLCGIYMDGQRHLPDPATFGPADPDALEDAVDQLAAYFRGERQDFDLPLHLVGTPFQRQVWAALQQIPYGETISYGELARRVGRPQAQRAVGLANGRNPISIVVPCHRVVGASGDLTGYGGGLDRKRHLLAHERRILGGTGQPLADQGRLLDSVT